MKALFSFIVVATLATSMAIAQERSAAGVTNGANVRLGTKVQSLNVLNQNVKTNVNMILECNKLGKFFNAATNSCDRPDIKDLAACARQGLLWDGSACVEANPAELADLRRIVACMMGGKVWNKSSNQCISDPEIARIENQLTQRIARVEGRTAAVENRAASLEVRAANLERRLPDLERRMSAAEYKIAETEALLLRSLACQNAGKVWIDWGCRDANINALNQSLNCQAAGYVRDGSGGCRTVVTSGMALGTTYGPRQTTNNSSSNSLTLYSACPAGTIVIGGDGACSNGWEAGRGLSGNSFYQTCYDPYGSKARPIAQATCVYVQ